MGSGFGQQGTSSLVPVLEQTTGRKLQESKHYTKLIAFALSKYFVVCPRLFTITDIHRPNPVMLL